MTKVERLSSHACDGGLEESFKTLNKTLHLNVWEMALQI